MTTSKLGGPRPPRRERKIDDCTSAPAGGISIALLLARAASADPVTTTTRVSVDSAGAQANARSSLPALSGDGRFVAFDSYAGNLVAGDTNGTLDVFVHDRQSGATTRVSVGGGAQANGASLNPALSADGRVVAFESAATNLVAGDTNGTLDVFVHDRQSGATTRVSVGGSGAQANGDSLSPALSADGRLVAFESSATNLVAGDANGSARDVFVHDRQAGTTTRVSVSSSGAQANAFSFWPALSGDGRFVSFTSYASNLVAGDSNQAPDIFVHDRQTGATRVSVTSSGVQGFDASAESKLSADGRLVAFDSYAENLVAGDTNVYPDIFVHDRQTGATTRVNVSSSGAQTNDDTSVPGISADGRFVSFQSIDPSLVAGDTNGTYDVFVHDRQTGATTRVSVDGGGAQANSGSVSAELSGDGSLVAFASGASNLVAGDTNNALDIFVRGSAPPVAQPPAISGFAPTGGPAGTAVSITGTGFTGATVVTFNGTGAAFTIGSDSQITATVPDAATSGPISVTTPNGTGSISASFTVTPPVVRTTISGFSPTRGPVGTRVTVTGTGFTGARAVTFGGRAASFVVDSDSQLTATVPNRARTGQITVQGASNSATSSTSFVVTRR